MGVNSFEEHQNLLQQNQLKELESQQASEIAAANNMMSPQPMMEMQPDQIGIADMSRVRAGMQLE